MHERDIVSLMEYSHRDLSDSREQIGKGSYPKSIHDSYFAVFYAGKALLLHLGTRSKSHRSVQAGIDEAVDRGCVHPSWRGVLKTLHDRRNEAVYRYARRNWTVADAEDTLRIAEKFVGLVEESLASK